MVVVELEHEEVDSLVAEALREGIKPAEILDQLHAGVTEIGERYAIGEYYISEVILCAEIMKDAVEALEPYLTGQDEEHCYEGTINMGTVQGDIHELGKI